MRTESNTSSRGFMIVLMLQIFMFIVALAGVALMVYSIATNFATQTFVSGLVMALSGSAAGVLLSLYSLRLH